MTASETVLASTNRPRTLVNIAALGFVLTGIVNTFLGPLLPTLILRWRLSDSQAGYFFTLQFLGSILGVIVSSKILPRRGFRFAIALSYLLMAIGVCGIIMSPWAHALAASSVLGLGFGIAIPSTNLLVSSVHHRRPAGPLSLINFCWGLGAVSVPVTIFFISGQRFLSLFLPALSAILILITLSLMLVGDEKILRYSEETRTSQKRPNFQRLVVMGAMFFLYVGIESSVGGWISTLARRDPSNVLGEWTLAPCLFWAGLLAGRGTAPLFLIRVRERHLAIAGLLIAVAGIVALVILTKWQYIAVAGLVVGLGLSPVFPITVALLAPFQATRNAGVMFALAGLGGAIMPELVGMVSTRTASLNAGLTVPLIATAILIWLHARIFAHLGQGTTTPVVQERPY